MSNPARHLHRLTGTWSSMPAGRVPLLLLGFSVAYYLAAELGISTSVGSEGIAIIWPANAITLFALASVEKAKWWLFLLAAVATEVAAAVPEYPLWAATGYGLVNFSEAALAVALLTRFAKDVPPLSGIRDFVLFIVFGPLFASGTAALAGAALYKIRAPELDYLHYWRVFWFGDGLGLLVVGTTLLAWRRTPVLPFGSRRHKTVEAVALAIGLLGAASWVFMLEADTPHVYLIFPFLLWAALRFGVLGACGAIVATVTIAIGSTKAGLGPFLSISTIETVISLQAVVAVVAVSTYLLAFSVEDSQRTTERLRREVGEHERTGAELQRAHRRLEQINKELDLIVAQRTSALEKVVARHEVLLKEVHHRVKNNLQLVSSILDLHGRAVSAPDLRDKLAEVRQQVASIAATYDVLHHMAHSEAADFSRIVPELCRDIGRAGGGLVSIAIEADGPTFVSADTAVGLSLALNELITNSIKHAGVHGDAAVVVECRREGDSVLLRVADNGPGFPDGFVPSRAKGFGMWMAQSVVAQAGGELRLAKSERGAVVEIRVPAAPDPEERGPRPAPAHPDVEHARPEMED